MKKVKNTIVAGGLTTAAGTATAVVGESVLWTVFSTGPGAVLTGAAETSAFLAWCGGGSLATGGGGMAAGSAVLGALGPVGWTVAGIGVTVTAISVIKSRKHKQLREI